MKSRHPRPALYLAALILVPALGWGAARWWEWRLHQPALAHHRRAEELMTAGRLDEAMVEWEAATRREPWWTEPYFRLAEELRTAGRPDEALMVLRKAADSAPSAQHVVCRIAETYLAMQDRVGAEEWGGVAVKKEPDCARAHLVCARTRLGRLPDTLEHYRRAYELTRDPTIQLELVQTHMQAGELQQAETVLRGYLAGQPATLETHYLLGSILARRARDAASAVEAESHFQAVLKADPKRYDAHAELGLLHERLRRWDQARRHFQTAWKLNPHSATILFHLATVMRQQRDPKAAGLWGQVRALQAKEKRWREARRELLTRPDDIPLMLEVARLSSDLGAWQAAATMLRAVLRRDPDNVEAQRGLRDLPDTSPIRATPPSSAPG